MHGGKLNNSALYISHKHTLDTCQRFLLSLGGHFDDASISHFFRDFGHALGLTHLAYGRHRQESIVAPTRFFGRAFGAPHGHSARRAELQLRCFTYAARFTLRRSGFSLWATMTTAASAFSLGPARTSRHDIFGKPLLRGNARQYFLEINNEFVTNVVLILYFLFSRHRTSGCRQGFRKYTAP